ncbi:MAG: reverse transcriptase family protein [Cyclobacteriaceae bacterium]|nr:reverse transcriptase family protein [Cyclobacteriaceae bacterium]
MHFSRFEKNQLKYLAAKLKCSIDELKFVLENVEDHYYEYSKYKKDKDGSIKTYSNGAPKKRTITPSKGALKKIQSNIKRNILDNVVMPTHIQGGVRGKSNISNAKIHQGKKYKFTTDLKDFFPSVNNGLVYSVFLKLGFTNVQANWLTRLTTYKYGLPQGAPTSPALSNLAFIPIDERLISLCQPNKITYTRYIDDLTFSSANDFVDKVREILTIVVSGGFRVSFRKTLYCGKQTITGIEVGNNYIDAPIKIREKVKEEKLSKTETKPFTNYLKRIRQTNTNRFNALN